MTDAKSGGNPVRYRLLATDYDGTLAHDGHVDSEVCQALERFLKTGRQLVLVTGRELHELLEILPQIELFAAVVAENGAMLYDTKTRQSRVLCEPPNLEFAKHLQARDVKPLSVGRAIIATFRPNETAVLDVIREMGLELQVIFNKDAVMILPSGVNKAVGLTAALQELGLTAAETVAVGDAENDHAFLALCGCAVAVENALPAVKERADLVTKAARGLGVVELIDRIIADDMPAPRHHKKAIEASELGVSSASTIIKAEEGSS